MPLPYPGERPGFLKALQNPGGNKPVSVIAEFKQASPSKGSICNFLQPEEAASQYSQNGADCISVLTEQEYFSGRLSYLERMAPYGKPILRKDFIFDALQIIETASTPASAVLLIVRMINDPLYLETLINTAESFGMQAIVEIFDEEDLKIARKANSKIIQVNARNLDTLAIDRRQCLQLAGYKKDHETWIAASGISTGKHLLDAAKSGYDAVLIGSSLMSGGTPGKKLAALLTSIPD